MESKKKVAKKKFLTTTPRIRQHHTNIYGNSSDENLVEEFSNLSLQRMDNQHWGQNPQQFASLAHQPDENKPQIELNDESDYGYIYGLDYSGKALWVPGVEKPNNLPPGNFIPLEDLDKLATSAKKPNLFPRKTKKAPRQFPELNNPRAESFSFEEEDCEIFNSHYESFEQRKLSALEEKPDLPPRKAKKALSVFSKSNNPQAEAFSSEEEDCEIFNSHYESFEQRELSAFEEKPDLPPRKAKKAFNVFSKSNNPQAEAFSPEEDYEIFNSHYESFEQRELSAFETKPDLPPKPNNPQTKAFPKDAYYRKKFDIMFGLKPDLAPNPNNTQLRSASYDPQNLSAFQRFFKAKKLWESEPSETEVTSSEENSQFVCRK